MKIEAVKLQNWDREGQGTYLYVLSGELNIVSVFDDTRYDRSDVDVISPAMRLHIAKKLKEIGFAQRSGNVFENKTTDERCLIPKLRALGTSPFHIADCTPKRTQDYYVLTPTQTACQIIRKYDVETAVEHIKALIKHQPLNIYRLSDYLESSEHNTDFLQAIGHLKYVQRETLDSPLKRVRPLSLTRH